MGGWVGWIEENEAVGMSYCELWVGGWVGGWVGKESIEKALEVCLTMHRRSGGILWRVAWNGWVGGWA